MNKKGFITATITVGLLLVVALILAVIFGGFSLFTWILGITIWRLIGAALIIFAGIAMIKGAIPPSYSLTIIIIGALLVFLPALFDVMGKYTLGVILGIYT